MHTKEQHATSADKPVISRPFTKNPGWKGHKLWGKKNTPPLPSCATSVPPFYHRLKETILCRHFGQQRRQTPRPSPGLRRDQHLWIRFPQHSQNQRVFALPLPYLTCIAFRQSAACRHPGGRRWLPRGARRAHRWRWLSAFCVGMEVEVSMAAFFFFSSCGS